MCMHSYINTNKMKRSTSIDDANLYCINGLQAHVVLCVIHTANDVTNYLLITYRQ